MEILDTEEAVTFVFPFFRWEFSIEFDKAHFMK